MKPRYVASAVIAMSVASYLDNVRGPLLPLLSQRLNLPYSQASWFFGMGNLASVVGLFSLIRLSGRITDRALSFLLVIMGSAAVAALYFVTSFPKFIAVAGLWGVSISLLGALGNMLLIQGTSHEERGRYFCGLHMMYGLASLVAPFVVAETVRFEYRFETAALVMIPFLLFLAVIGAGLTKNADTQNAPTAHRLSQTQIWILILFASYVAGEVLISTWMVTYLVDFKHYSMGSAAAVLSWFFLAMGLSRGVCFFKLPPRWETWLMGFSILVALAGSLMGRYVWPPALVIAGLVGPLFPLMMARSSRVFPEQSRSLTLWILGSIQLTLMASQWLMGRVADRFGLETAYLLPNGFLLVSAVALVVYLRLEKKHLGAFRA